MSRPRIGVVAQPLVEGRVRGWPSRAFGVPATYVGALRRAGAMPVLFPPPTDVEELLGLVDGVLLMGGGDVEPSRYGGADRPELYGIEPTRDELELAVVDAAERSRVPLLAICRGIQVLNVAHRGTLHQHLPEVEGAGTHGEPTSGDPVDHDVKLAPGSRIALAAGADVVAASSHHHQAIDVVGDGLVATGWTEDGLVEAIEVDGDGWVIGVQWHPEDTAERDPAQQRLFDELVRRAERR